MAPATLPKDTPKKPPESAGNQPETARLAIVGAGPGDPGLLTMRAYDLLQAADTVVYDRLVSEEILALLPEKTARVFAGKASRNHFVKQEDINALLVDQARTGKRVVRLKGGDPFIFGRGSEEAQHLAENGIPFEIVPGVTAATGCSARSAIPLTHRELSRSVTFVTGHLKNDGALDLNWTALADPRGTAVIYMGLANSAEISSQLIAHGLPGGTPAAIIEKGTTPDQRTVLTTVAALATAIETHGISSPALLVIGQVAAMAETLNWASALIQDKTRAEA
ncbi:MAG: uroporphyrinogen-III C-methyltransferase [Rhodospirillaceae bacterium]